jgi:integrase
MGTVLVQVLKFMSDKYNRFIRRMADGRFRLDVPAQKSPSGVRIRERHDTQALAIGRAKELFVAQENVAIAVSNITPAQALDATSALALLASYPAATLLDAARIYCETMAARNASVPFGEALDRFIKSKQKRSRSLLTQYRWFRSQMEPLHDRLVCSITLADLEGLLAAKPDGTYSTFRRYGSAVLNFANLRGWAHQNPFRQLERREPDRHEPVTLPAERLQRLLNVALDRYLELVPFLVFGFFCGIRSDVNEGEITRLLWSDIDRARKEIVVRAEVSKTKKRRRFVPISDNAIAWIEAYRQRGGTMTGPVLQLYQQKLRRLYRKAQKDTGFDRGTMVQAIARHSFCSNWLARHKDINGLVLISGHDNVRTMWNHYYAAVSPEQALAYWNVRPSCGRANVVAFESKIAAAA